LVAQWPHSATTAAIKPSSIIIEQIHLKVFFFLPRDDGHCVTGKKGKKQLTSVSFIHVVDPISQMTPSHGWLMDLLRCPISRNGSNLQITPAPKNVVTVGRSTMTGGLEPWNFMTFHRLGKITPTAELILFRGVGIPPTSWTCNKKQIYNIVIVDLQCQFHNSNVEPAGFSSDTWPFCAKISTKKPELRGGARNCISSIVQNSYYI
jgi:hypothetical protein